MIAPEVLSVMIFPAEAVVTTSPAFLEITIDSSWSMNRCNMSFEISLPTHRSTLAGLGIDAVREVTVVSLCWLRRLMCDLDGVITKVTIHFGILRVSVTQKIRIGGTY